MPRLWLQWHFQANQKMAILWLMSVVLFLWTVKLTWIKYFIRPVTLRLKKKRCFILHILWEITPLIIFRFIESRQGWRKVSLSLCLSHLWKNISCAVLWLFNPILYNIGNAGYFSCKIVHNSALLSGSNVIFSLFTFTSLLWVTPVFITEKPKNCRVSF